MSALAKARGWVRGRPDEPALARPALLAVAALAGVSYAWGIAGAPVEAFYGAAARSMSESWHAFVFGAFDPAGTITVDKLPGALWAQAFSLRLFGFHLWAIVLPQVVEGVLTVLVLHRAVARLAGPVAGLTAAVVVAATPVTALTNRGNVSDSLLVLLLVLAADAASAALTTGSTRSLAFAGAWVGLAFQAKMTQAWLVLPPLFAAFGMAAPISSRRRLVACSVALVVALGVSLSWMAAVSLVPAHARPYVDGSTDNSEFAQVFVYNGTDRFSAHPSGLLGETAPFLTALARQGTALGAETAGVPRSWHRLLSGPFGSADAWFFPVAAFAALAVLAAARGRPRGDPRRAAVVLWGTWLVLHLVIFSAARSIRPYYAVAIAPAVAALCGTGVGELVTGHRRKLAGAGGTLIVLVSAAYGIFLLPPGVGVRGWLVPAEIAGAAVVVALGAAVVVLRRARPSLVAAAAASGAVAVLLMPAVVTVVAVQRHLGPFDTPLEPAAVAAVNNPPVARDLVVAARYLHELAGAGGATYPVPLATETSVLAASYILATGEEVLPIGGYNGAAPSPTLEELRLDVTTGRLRFVLVAAHPASSDSRVVWLLAHCRSDPPIPTGRLRAPVLLWLYDCSGAR